MNSYDGEVKIKLYDKIYPMRVNLGVIAEFQSDTGKCFNSVACSALNAWQEISDSECSVIERAAVLCECISMEDAARFFYLCAKNVDSQVTFEEIQEAVLMEGAVSRHMNGEFTRSYPVLFVDICLFALVGIYDQKKN